MSQHHQVLIIGGGTAGIITAAQLIRQHGITDIGIIEPAEQHYYQPAFTLVGAGTYRYEKTIRPMSSVIPKKARWIKDKATGIQPDKNTVNTENSGDFTYDYLVVAPGLVYDLDLVPGLSEGLENGVVCSNYIDPQKTWKLLKNFNGGTALFTQPTTPFKCGGAPQKTAYLSDGYFRKKKIREQSQVVLALPGASIFGVPEIKKTLMKVVNRKNIDLRLGHRLVKIDSAAGIAWFNRAEHEKYHNTDPKVRIETDGDLTGIYYDFLHTAPPSTAPGFIQESVLADENKWFRVDKHTMQNPDYPNVFGLGDVVGLTSAVKTGGAARKQAAVVVETIANRIKSKKSDSQTYNGYSSCPLVTDYGKMVLAEFDYDSKFTPNPKLKLMLIRDSSKEHWRLWLLKKYGLPYLYWKKMMKGKAVK